MPYKSVGFGAAPFIQLELSASNTVKVDYRLPVTCSDFNSTTVNSLGLDFIDLLMIVFDDCLWLDPLWFN